MGAATGCAEARVDGWNERYVVDVYVLDSLHLVRARDHGCRIRSIFRWDSESHSMVAGTPRANLGFGALPVKAAKGTSRKMAYQIHRASAGYDRRHHHGPRYLACVLCCICGGKRWWCLGKKNATWGLR